MKILLIEPDKILAGNISHAFKQRGHQLLWRREAQTGIEGADAFEPEAIILDLQLAGHSGIEFLHELRSYGDWQEVPVIIYSSLHPDVFGGLTQAKRTLTITNYLHKPSVSLQDLVEAVETASGKL